MQMQVFSIDIKGDKRFYINYMNLHVIDKK